MTVNVIAAIAKGVKMNTLENVKQWFIDRDLENGGRLDKQSLKLSEEFGELCAGYLKKNEKLTKDSIRRLRSRDCRSGVADKSGCWIRFLMKFWQQIRRIPYHRMSGPLQTGQSVIFSYQMDL